MESRSKSESTRTTFVMIGLQGSGKSSTANSFIGRQEFPSAAGTRKCTEDFSHQHCNNDFIVVDSPPVDDKQFHNRVKIYLQENDLDRNVCYVFILKAGRISSEEINTLLNFHSLFRQSLLVFTNVAELGILGEDMYDDEKLKNYIDGSHNLSRLASDFSFKTFGIDNVNWDQPVKHDKAINIMTKFVPESCWPDPWKYCTVL